MLAQTCFPELQSHLSSRITFLEWSLEDYFCFVHRGNSIRRYRLRFADHLRLQRLDGVKRSVYEMSGVVVYSVGVSTRTAR